MPGGPRHPTDIEAPLQPRPIKPDAELARYHPDRVRAYLVYGIVGLLTFIVLVLTARLFQGELDTSEYVEIVFPAVFGLAGTAVGFYFSEQAKRD